MNLLTQQPVKGIYTLFAILFNLARLPYWVLRYSIPSLRPHPKWTFSQALRLRMMRAFLYTSAIIQVRIPVALEPGKEGNQWEVISPPESKYFTGVATCDPEVKPVKIGGTWYPEPLSAASAKSAGFVVLYFHGGAFVIGDGRKEDAGFAAKTLIANTDVTHVYSVQYRLSTIKNGHFPAHLQDAITSYCHLIHNLGMNPKKIVVSGDSAGANICLALLRYISEHGDKVGLPSPVCAWLWSPWVKPRNAYYDSSTVGPNDATDFITGTFGAWGARAVAPSTRSGLTIETPYLNPVDDAFATSTPLYISTGEVEALFEEDTELYEKFSRVKGNKVEFQVEENAHHDIILTGPVSGFADGAKRAAQRAGEYLRRVTAASKL